MSSGRKERILITCATFEVAKIVEPAKFYDVTKVHIIHYGDTGVYREFYDEVCRQLKDWKPDLPIESHDKDKVYEFTPMMNKIMYLISEEKNENEDPDIFVNISSGTHEFTAAAVIASMMWENTLAFTVPTLEYKVKDDMVRTVYYAKDKVTPIGLTESTKEPVKLTTYTIPKPDRKLVLGLGILEDRLDNKQKIAAPDMIGVLAVNGLISPTYVHDQKVDQKTIMNYQRNFIDKWSELGWINRISKRELEITDEGHRIIKTFRDCYLLQKRKS